MAHHQSMLVPQGLVKNPAVTFDNLKIERLVRNGGDGGESREADRGGRGGRAEGQALADSQSPSGWERESSHFPPPRHDPKTGLEGRSLLDLASFFERGAPDKGRRNPKTRKPRRRRRSRRCFSRLQAARATAEAALAAARGQLAAAADKRVMKRLQFCRRDADEVV